MKWLRLKKRKKRNPIPKKVKPLPAHYIEAKKRERIKKISIRRGISLEDAREYNASLENKATQFKPNRRRRNRPRRKSGHTFSEKMNARARFGYPVQGGSPGSGKKR